MKTLLKIIKLAIFGYLGLIAFFVFLGAVGLMFY